MVIKALIWELRGSRVSAEGARWFLRAPPAPNPLGCSRGGEEDRSCPWGPRKVVAMGDRAEKRNYGRSSGGDTAAGLPHGQADKAGNPHRARAASAVLESRKVGGRGGNHHGTGGESPPLRVFISRQEISPAKRVGRTENKDVCVLPSRPPPSYGGALASLTRVPPAGSRSPSRGTPGP